MERHIQTFLDRLSYASIIIATITLISLFLLQSQTSNQTCLGLNNKHTPAHSLPSSTCNSPTSRPETTLDKHNARVHSTRYWHDTVSSHARLFSALGVRNDSRVLCVSAGAGHAAAALAALGVADVTAVELVASPPLVSRADPLDLPFFDGAFDLVFAPRVAESLFPDRAAAEIERTVRLGGKCAVVLDQTGLDGVSQIARLFRSSELVEALNSSLNGSVVTRIVLRKIKIRS